MKKRHIIKIILRFVFIIIFISCKNKNNEIITIENTDKVNNDLSAKIEKTSPEIELYDETQQKEIEDYLLGNNDIINFDSIFFYDFIIRHGEENILYYYFLSEWYDGVIKYEQFIQIGLVKINENEYTIFLEKYFLPFGEFIKLHTLATFNGDKYIFKTRDGWDNIVVGNFYFNEDNVLLRMECEKSFDIIGKNITGRQYGGDLYVLKKSNYYKNKDK
jgi:hypothetical protein